MRSTDWPWLRLLVGAAILGILVWRLGSEPVLDGLRATSPGALALALVVTAATTWCCARRWALVADRLGDPVPRAAAYPAYYRSQLVNASLPLGVVGDVHRAVRHGLKAVVWERGLGQLVQAALTVLVLLIIPSVLGWTAAVIAVVAVACVGAVVLAARRQARRLLDGRLLAEVALLSSAAVGGHLLVFVVAARTAGVDAPLTALVPVGALVLLASAVPTSVAGWGPREGVAAWAFAQTGLGASAGLTVSVTFGVMALVATLPGLLVLLAAVVEVREERAPRNPRRRKEIASG